MTTITDLDDFKALDPFFRIIEKGLDGIADGGHFFDLLADGVIFEYIITTPGYPRRVEGRTAVAELYRPYGTMIVLERCHDLAVHHDTKTGVVVLEYASEGRVVATGAPTPTGTSRYSRSPIARSPTGATTSTRSGLRRARLAIVFRDGAIQRHAGITVREPRASRCAGSDERCARRRRCRRCGSCRPPPATGTHCCRACRDEAARTCTRCRWPGRDRRLGTR